MTRRLLAAALLALAGCGGPYTPAGQPPLTKLTAANFGELRARFNGDSDYARLIVMLSPT